MNRIDQKFEELKAKKKKAFIAFLTSGDPSLKRTEELVVSFEKSGVDIVELGVPFSDPLADGPTIQTASQRALKKGVTLSKILETVKSIRRSSNIPVALMTYYNPVFHYGEKKFVRDAKKAGVDGLIIPDLPPEEAKDLIREARVQEIATIFFISPTTTDKRMKQIIQASTGFIYYVSLAGVTGARKRISASVKSNVKKVKRFTQKPVCVGFGVSDAVQVRQVSAFADGVIVGSAIVNRVLKNQEKKNLVKNVSAFVRSLTKAL